jgi:NADPH2 dehydrogenase
MLFENYHFSANVTAKNRVIMPPMCINQCHTEDGIVNDIHISHYGSRAWYGVGMIIVEATAVEARGRITNQDLGIWDDVHISGLKRLTNIMKNYDVVSCIQLAHAGRKAGDAPTPVAPSKVAFNDRYKEPIELSVSDIKDIINHFKKAAKRASEAGFDAIELHGAHGYLINQFLSPLSNFRTDQYGGNHENRFRILYEIIDEVKKVFKGLIFVRFSCEEYHDDGLHPADFVNELPKLKEAGISLIDVSSGGVVPTTYKPFVGYQIPYAKAIKDADVLPVAAVGLIEDPVYANEVLKEQSADFICVGRALLKDPMWALHASIELGHKLDLGYPYSRIF